jgi:hypothetical protein
MSLVFQEIIILAIVIGLAIFSALETRDWYIDTKTINIKVQKVSAKGTQGEQNKETATKPKEANTP